MTCIPDMLLYAAEITMFESNIVVFKFVQDLHFYVTGGDDENELILAAVLQGFFDAVSLLLRYFWLQLLPFFGKKIKVWFHDYLVSVSVLFTFPYPVHRSTVDKREALENLDLIFLCLDEIVERGYAICS